MAQQPTILERAWTASWKALFLGTTSLSSFFGVTAVADATTLSLTHGDTGQTFTTSIKDGRRVAFQTLDILTDVNAPSFLPLRSTRPGGAPFRGVHHAAASAPIPATATWFIDAVQANTPATYASIPHRLDLKAFENSEQAAQAPVTGVPATVAPVQAPSPVVVTNLPDFGPNLGAMLAAAAIAGAGLMLTLTTILDVVGDFARNIGANRRADVPMLARRRKIVGPALAATGATLATVPGTVARFARNAGANLRNGASALASRGNSVGPTVAAATAGLASVPGAVTGFARNAGANLRESVPTFKQPEKAVEVEPVLDNVAEVAPTPGSEADLLDKAWEKQAGVVTPAPVVAVPVASPAAATVAVAAVPATPPTAPSLPPVADANVSAASSAQELVDELAVENMASAVVAEKTRSYKPLLGIAKNQPAPSITPDNDDDNNGGGRPIPVKQSAPVDMSASTIVMTAEDHTIARAIAATIKQHPTLVLENGGRKRGEMALVTDKEAGARLYVGRDGTISATAGATAADFDVAASYANTLRAMPNAKFDIKLDMTAEQTAQYNEAAAKLAVPIIDTVAAEGPEVASDAGLIDDPRPVSLFARAKAMLANFGRRASTATPNQQPVAENEIATKPASTTVEPQELPAIALPSGDVFAAAQATVDQYRGNGVFLKSGIGRTADELSLATTPDRMPRIFAHDNAVEVVSGASAQDYAAARVYAQNMKRLSSIDVKMNSSIGPDMLRFMAQNLQQPGLFLQPEINNDNGKMTLATAANQPAKILFNDFGMHVDLAADATDTDHRMALVYLHNVKMVSGIDIHVGSQETSDRLNAFALRAANEEKQITQQAWMQFAEERASTNAWPLVYKEPVAAPAAEQVAVPAKTPLSEAGATVAKALRDTVAFYEGAVGVAINDRQSDNFNNRVAIVTDKNTRARVIIGESDLEILDGASEKDIAATATYYNNLKRLSGNKAQVEMKMSDKDYNRLIVETIRQSSIPVAPAKSQETVVFDDVAAILARLDNLIPPSTAVKTSLPAAKNLVNEALAQAKAQTHTTVEEKAGPSNVLQFRREPQAAGLSGANKGATPDFTFTRMAFDRFIVKNDNDVRNKVPGVTHYIPETVFDSTGKKSIGVKFYTLIDGDKKPVFTADKDGIAVHATDAANLAVVLKLAAERYNGNIHFSDVSPELARQMIIIAYQLDKKGQLVDGKDEKLAKVTINGQSLAQAMLAERRKIEPSRPVDTSGGSQYKLGEPAAAQ